jgi:hypothetical protein
MEARDHYYDTLEKTSRPYVDTGAHAYLPERMAPTSPHSSTIYTSSRPVRISPPSGQCRMPACPTFEKNIKIIMIPIACPTFGKNIKLMMIPIACRTFEKNRP